MSESWASKHTIETGHRTQESLTDPGSCSSCGARSPMYEMTKEAGMSEQTEGAGVEEHTPTTQEVRTAYVTARYETEGVNNPRLWDEFARWLAGIEAAAEARGAERVLAAVEATGWHHLGDDYYAGAMEHAKEDIVRAAVVAARGTEGGS